MMKKKKLILAFIVASCFSFLGKVDVGAATCQSFYGNTVQPIDDNNSIRNACDRLKDVSSSASWWGAMWLSGSNDVNNLSDDIVFNQSSGTAKVYLRGLAICGASSACDSPTAKCGYIKILRTEKEYPAGGNVGWSTWNEFKNWGPITNLPAAFSEQASFARPVFGRNETLRAVSSGAITLDIDKLKQSGNYDTRIANKDGKYVKSYTYKTIIKPFRVGDHNDPSNGGSAEETTVSITIPATHTIIAYAATDTNSTTGEAKYIKSDGSVTGWQKNPPSDVRPLRYTNTVPYGTKLIITRKFNMPSGYQWKEWRWCASQPGGGINGSENCTINSVRQDGRVFAIYQKASVAFSGRSRVNGTSNDTNYTSTTKDAGTYFFTCNDPINGCEITFKHAMKRNGSSSTTYSIERASNYIQKGVTNAVLVSNGTFNASEKEVMSDKVIMYPGQVVCETLTFDNNGALAGGGGQKTKVCAAAVGDAQPPCGDTCTPNCDPNTDRCDSDGDKDPVGANSIINIKVKNPDAATKYHKYQKVVYAKPGNTLTYRTTYNPVLQYTYDLRPDQMKIDGFPSSPYINSLKYGMGVFFNSNKSSSMPTWNSAFSVNAKNGGFYHGEDYTSDKDGELGPGKTTVRNSMNSYTVRSDDVGSSLDEIAEINRNANVQTTPSQVSFSKNENANLGDVKTQRLESTASAKVPYNFVLSTKITDKPEEKTFYAGEEGSVDFEIKVSKKKNNETNAEYATRVDNAKYRLKIKYEENGTTKTFETKAKEGVVLNGLSAENGIIESFTNTNGRAVKFNVPDLPAGSRICMQSIVWPRDSGSDTNMSPSGYTDIWESSDEVCFKIAKKPSIAIWGGNIFSAGKIVTAVSVKNNLVGYDNNYNIDQDANQKRYIFGSWTELGLISTGNISGLASGAGTGVGKSENGILTPALTGVTDGNGNNVSNVDTPGGKIATNSQERSFCLRSTLSFANEDCNSIIGTVGDLGSDNSITTAIEDKENIIKQLEVTNVDKETKHKVGGTLVIDQDHLDDTKKSTNGSYYYYSSGDLTLAESIIKKSTTHMVHAAKTITITGKISYGGSGYKTMSDIPKLIIYAEQDVMIACNVEQIDALIIAGGKVNTCDSEDINSRENSNQLIINGAVVAGRLEANRTYGAATGNNSIIPAEIINFDPSLYLFTSNNSTSSITTNPDSNLVTTYLVEVAPRY